MAAGVARFLLVLLILIQPAAAQSLTLLDGGNCYGNSCLFVMRNPFFYGPSSCGVDFEILSPLDETYYNNNVDINLSVVSGDSCFYRVIQGESVFGWNEIVCGGNTKTMPDGSFILEVKVSDDLCSVSKFRSVTVEVARPSLGRGIRQAGWYPLLFLAAIIFLDRRRKKQRESRT